jgi:hypothetical protein
MDAGATRQGMGRQRHGDFFVTVDPKNWKWLKKEEEEDLCINSKALRGNISTDSEHCYVVVVFIHTSTVCWRKNIILNIDMSHSGWCKILICLKYYEYCSSVCYRKSDNLVKYWEKERSISFINVFMSEQVMIIFAIQIFQGFGYALK